MKTFKHYIATKRSECINETWLLTAKPDPRIYRREELKWVRSFDIFKNPTAKEFKECEGFWQKNGVKTSSGYGCRFICTNNGKGDLYIFDPRLLHDVAIKMLKTEKNINLSRSSSILAGFTQYPNPKPATNDRSVDWEGYHDDRPGYEECVNIRHNKNVIRMFGGHMPYVPSGYGDDDVSTDPKYQKAFPDKEVYDIH